MIAMDASRIVEVAIIDLDTLVKVNLVTPNVLGSDSEQREVFGW